MVGVQSEVVGVRQFAIEVHAALELCHFLHTAHIFALSNHHRLVGGSECCERHIELALFDGRNLRFEEGRSHGLLVGGEFRLLVVFFADKIVDYIRVNTHETALFVLLLKHTHERNVELTVHHQHIVALIVCGFDIGVLCLLIGSVKINEVAILVGLVALNQLLVVVEFEELAFGVGNEGKLHGLLAELLIAEHTVFDENLDVVPLFLKSLGVFLRQFLQTRSHLFSDVGGNLLHVAVGLQIATRYVQRNIWRIDNTLKQHHEVRHNAFHAVGYEHLVAIELDAVFANVEVVLDFWEVENTGEGEREVNIQVNPKQRVFLTGLDSVVELDVVLVFEFGWSAGPQWFNVVDHLVGVGIHVFTVFPFLFLAENHRHWHEAAVFVEQCADAVFFQIFLFLIVDIHHDVGTALSLFTFLHVVFRRAVASPLHSLCAFLVGECVDFHFL